MEIFEIAFRSLVVYLFIVVGIRIFGKKELSQLSIVDLAFILLISNSVQNAMVGGSISLEGGLIAAATLFIANHLFENLLFRSQKLSKWVQGEPVMLVYRGRVKEENMAKAKISIDDLEAAVREHGIKSIRDADLVILERDGTMSVLGENFKQTSKKRKSHRVYSTNQ